jgi:hypothetical protein
MQLFAGTSLAEIVCKWLDLQELHQRKELSNAVLQRSTR